MLPLTSYSLLLLVLCFASGLNATRANSRIWRHIRRLGDISNHVPQHKALHQVIDLRRDLLNLANDLKPISGDLRRSADESVSIPLTTLQDIDGEISALDSQISSITSSWSMSRFSTISPTSTSILTNGVASNSSTAEPTPFTTATTPTLQQEPSALSSVSELGTTAGSSPSLTSSISPVENAAEPENAGTSSDESKDSSTPPFSMLDPSQSPTTFPQQAHLFSVSVSVDPVTVHVTELCSTSTMRRHHSSVSIPVSGTNMLREDYLSIPTTSAAITTSPPVLSSGATPLPSDPPSNTSIPLSSSLNTTYSTSSSFISTTRSITSSPSTFTTSFLPNSSGTGTSISASTNTSISISISTNTSTPTSGYKFNPASPSNLVVYFGQTAHTSSTSLLAQCQDPDIDIVILAFVVTFFGLGGYPEVNFGAACGGQTPLQASKAPGLLSCPLLASQISQCQALGKKVFLSVGGATGSAFFNSDAQAAQFATTIWNLFGAGTGEEPQLRPFGDVQIDGFDIDNENHNPTHYSAFTSALRALFPKPSTSAPSPRTYYISAAPQCPRPDASIPLDLLRGADFVWVQFFNNPDCQTGSPGFLESFRAWSNDLAGGAGSGQLAPRLYLGAVSFAGGGSGYLPASGIVGLVKQVEALGLPNFGGVMLWDGPEAHRNLDSHGMSFSHAVKQGF
ncbi:MAG: hypothetical protein M1829_006379 [Trizodia sp. TS-e1964]|nr:MAG: hypothetical protein M1829_006379 [Trizodia sp. TS-e1964]